MELLTPIFSTVLAEVMNPESFLYPDISYRPAPFWAVNDTLEPAEVARQLSGMLQHGFSGGFFHSRTGLQSRYLGEEWFAAVRAAINAARKNGGHLWLYDEDQWPSGNAGGQIAAMDDRYRAASLEAEFVPGGGAARADGEDVPHAAYRIEGRTVATVSGMVRIDLAEALAPQDAERLILRRRYEPKRNWFNGQSAVNLLEPEVASEFLRRTHEVYKEHIGDQFGKTVPGVFTDEPNLHVTGEGFPWWEAMPEIHAEWTGRDFWEDAPWMFFDGTPARAARLHLHRTVLRQFAESYSKPVYQWCDRNGLVSTGHFLEESTFEWQLRATWGGIMAHYRWMHMPGIDHLCRQLNVDLPLLLAGKQASSVARQLGRPRVLVEAFACIRHSSTLEDFRWLADANLALGANFFCPHMQVYSMRGRRKRDYPPNVGEVQTWWQDYGDLNDYVARLCYALTRGEAAPDLLILHPIQNAMADHRLGIERAGALVPSDLPGAETSTLRNWDTQFRQIVEATLNAGFDCDLGDEGMLADFGSVEGSCLRVGEMRYPLVVVPPSRTWCPATVGLLEHFVSAGGKLLFVGSHPSEVDCLSAADRWAVLAKRSAGSIACSGPALQTALDRLLPDGVCIRTADGRPAVSTWVNKRRDGGRMLLFLVNTHRERPQSYELRLPGNFAGAVSRWNARTGGSQPVSITGGRFLLDLNHADSALLVIDPAAQPDGLVPPPASRPESVVPLCGPWEYRRSEPNVLVIDRLATSVDGGQTWADEDMDHRVRQRIARHFGAEAALEWQPWVVRENDGFRDKGGPVALRYRFHVGDQLPVSASLVLEWIPGMRVTLNGSALDFQNAVMHWERSFRLVPVAELLRVGENVVEICFGYHALSEIEPVYVIGDFGVRLDGQQPVITPESTLIQTGSWVWQGLPFYSGEITYRIPFEAPADSSHSRLRLRDPRGSLVRIRINGRDAGKILWNPYEIDLAPFIRNGGNLLEITVVGSRQNTFGPLHDQQSDGEGAVASPDHYQNEDFLREQWSLHDYGLMGGLEFF